MSKKKVNGKKLTELQLKELIQKFGTGGMIGQSIGAAANLAVPGLGAVLSPVLGAIGNSFDEKKLRKDAVNQQFSNISQADNPYGYAFGGDPTDPPTKKGQALLLQQPMQQSSTVTNIPQMKLGTWENKPIPKREDYPNATPQQYDALFTGAHRYNNILIDSGLEGKTKLFDPYMDRREGESDEAFTQRIAQPSPTTSYAYGGAIQKKYGIGGMMKGDMDLASYHGQSHKNGGIKIDDSGKPSPTGTKEVEGKETRMDIGGQVYIFSDQLTI